MPLLVATFALAAIGCGRAGGPTASAAPSATSSAAPTMTAQPPSATAATALPSASPLASTSATGTEPQAPPAGVIAVGSEQGVPGSPGSWCYDGTCLDGPPGPVASLPLVEPAAGASLSFEMPGTHAFNHWSVGYTANADEDAIELASGGRVFDPDLASSTIGPLMSSFTFDGPPSGDWLVSVALQFGDRGQAVYYWHFSVP